MMNFLQAMPAEPQPGFFQQYSFLIMIGLMVLVLWLFMWAPKPNAATDAGVPRRTEKRRQGNHGKAESRHGQGSERDLAVIEVDSDVTCASTRHGVADNSNQQK